MDIIVPSHKDIKTLSPFMQGIVAAMIRADKKAKAENQANLKQSHQKD